jgi:hypothetical protein
VIRWFGGLVVRQQAVLYSGWICSVVGAVSRRIGSAQPVVRVFRPKKPAEAGVPLHGTCVECFSSEGCSRSCQLVILLPLVTCVRWVAGAEGTGHHFITALMMRLSQLMPMTLVQEQM